MMQDSTVNHKRIAKNTVFLYIRMIVVMGIGLYTVRAILDLLGVTMVYIIGWWCCSYVLVC